MLVKSLVIYRASGTSVLASGSSTSWWSEQYRGGRSLPSHRDLGYSPHMIVFGREAVGPLDMLYSGWMEKHLGNVDVEEWLIRLNDQLAMIHDFASATEANAIDSRVCTYNKGKCDRVLNVGDKVL